MINTMTLAETTKYTWKNPLVEINLVTSNKVKIICNVWDEEEEDYEGTSREVILGKRKYILIKDQESRVKRFKIYYSKHEE